MATKTKDEKRRARAKQRLQILHYLTSEDSWMVVQVVVDDLFTNRRDVLHDYVRTEGHTDWVWLEEHLDAAMNNSQHFEELGVADAPYDPSNAGFLHADYFDKNKRYSAYIACFALALATIQIVHPQVRGPSWFTQYLPLIQNRKVVPSDIAEIARDAFLSGRDQEALALVAPLREGPFILWHNSFFREVDAGVRPHLQVRLPEGSRFVVECTRLRDDTTDVRTAIGIAMQFFTTTERLATVRVDTSASIWRGGVHAWHGVVVFAISNNEHDIVAIEESNRDMLGD